VQGRLIHQYPLVSIGWINHEIPLVKWSEPDMKEAAKNLIDLGAKAIIFKPIGWATENYETIIEVEEVIKSLQRQHSDLTYIRMGCANDHPDFLKMAAEWANPYLETLLASSSGVNDVASRPSAF
jgi:protoporphyrin/coproporphyrin ferrochelatase